MFEEAFMRQIGFFSILGSIAIVSACSSGGSSSGGGGAASVTSIDQSKVITSLSDGEIAQFCADISAFTKTALADASFRRYSCGSSAGLAAKLKNPETDEALRAECRAQVETCIAKPSTPPSSDSNSKCPAEVRASKCGAPISEYTQCLSDQVESFRAIAASTDFCGALTLKDTTPKAKSPPPPASCSSLAAKCSDLDLE